MITSAYVTHKISIEPSLAGHIVHDWDGPTVVVPASHSGSPVRARLRVDPRPEPTRGDPLQLASHRAVL